MKKIQITTLFVLIASITFNCSCDIQHNYRSLSNNFLEIDSVAIVGEEFHFGFKLSKKDAMILGEQPLFARIIARRSSIPSIPDGSYTVIRLTKEPGTHNYFGNFPVSDILSDFKLMLSTGTKWYAAYKSPTYLVNTTKGDLLQNGNGVLIRYSHDDSYVGYFYNERSRFPNNIAIFVTRWVYEYQKDLLVKDTLEKHIAYLDAHYQGNEYYPYVRFIGWHFLYGTLDIPNLKKIESRKNAKPLNHGEISLLLHSILSNYPDRYAVILQRNPLSGLAERPFSRPDFIQIDPNVLLQVIDARKAHYNDVLYDFYKASVIYRSFPDSMNIAFNIMTSLVEKMNREYPFFSKGEDRDELVYVLHKRIYYVASDVCVAIGEYDKAIQILEDNKRDLLAKQGDYLGIIYLKQGNIEMKRGNRQKALSDYLRAHYYVQDLPDLIDSLHVLFASEDRTDTSFSAWMDSLQLALPSDAVPLPVNMPDFMTETDELNPYALGKQTLLVFWSESCHICEVEVRDILSYFSKKNPKGVRVIFIPENLKAFQERYKKMPICFRVVQNSPPFLTAFNIDAFPVSILIDGKGNIIRLMDGYGGRDNLFSMLDRLDTDK